MLPENIWKKPQKKLTRQKGKGTHRLTSVESEFGRIACTVTGELASQLTPKERIKSLAVHGYQLQLTTITTYRNACNLLNSIFHRSGDDTFKLRTVSDNIESDGNEITEILETKSAEILKHASFDPESGLPLNPESLSEGIRNPSFRRMNKAEIRKLTAPYNKVRDRECQIKRWDLLNNIELDPGDCVYISIDDVGVKHQKDTRKDGGTKEGKYVENTVIHIQSVEGEYTLTGIGMDNALKLLLAYLLKNNLLENRQLIFFSDGARNIRNGIEKYFDFCPSIHMLDWYHLEKRMTELTSMALKGTKSERYAIREHMDSMLWAGNVDDTIKYLKGLAPKNVKNNTKLKEAIDYLERKKDFICCYAIRKLLGYRNSSNSAEKTNDLIVAERQKHNGMSWSSNGSHALAIVTASVRNGEIDNWLHGKPIRFSPCPAGAA